MRMEILSQNLAEVFLSGAVRWPIVVSEVEVGYAAIEGAANRGTSSLEDVCAAKVLPETERDGRKDNAGSATTTKLGILVSFCIRDVTHAIRSSPSGIGSLQSGPEALSTFQ
jgi:hypothetical protein